MRSWILLAALLAVVQPAGAQEARLPPGWQMRLDRKGAPAENVQLRHTNGMLHVALGPSGIFYRPADQARGAHRFRATFEQLRSVAHPEGYGLLVGGRDLDGVAQVYLYFLIRQDGRFTIRRRAGHEIHTLHEWTASPAVRRMEGDRPASNTLVVESDAAAVRFRVNGVEVARLPRGEGVDTDGVVGLRVNHNLELRVGGMGVEPLR